MSYSLSRYDRDKKRYEHVADYKTAAEANRAAYDMYRENDYEMIMVWYEDAPVLTKAGAT